MAQFIKSAANQSDWIVDSIPEVVLIGRSNVGKSSLINALAKQKIAITSKTPGRTQLANFYDFGDFRLVDLPGYGYAKVKKQQQNELVKIIDQTLMTRANVFCILHIVDANVITQEDLAMAQYLKTRFVHHYFLLNKADKQSLKHYLSQKAKYAKYLQIKPEQIVFTSSKKDINLTEVKKIINQVLSQI